MLYCYKCTKYLRVLLAVVALMLLLCTTAAAAEKQEQHTYKVGFYYLPGVNEIDKDARFDGYNYELLERIKLYCNHDYYLDGYDEGMDKQLAALERGELDMIPGIAKTPERLQRFLFTENSIGVFATTVTVRKDDDRFQLSKPSHGIHMKIGMMKGSYCNELFAAKAKDYGVSYEPVYFDTFKQLEQALAAKEIDGLVSNNMEPVPNGKIVEVLGYKEHFIALNRNNTALKKHLDEIFENMDTSSPFWRQVLQMHHNRDMVEGTVMHLEPAELEYLQQLQNEGRVLKVLPNPNRAPLSKWNGEKYEGIMIDAFAEIAKRLKLKYELLPVKDRDDFDKAWQSREADIVLGFYDDYQMPYREYRLTTPYLVMNMAMLYRKESEGKIKSFAMLQSYSGKMQRMMEEVKPEGADAISYPNSDLCMEAVLKGEADATVIFSYAAQQELLKDHRNVLAMRELPGKIVGISLGVAKREPHLLASALQKAVTSIRGTYVPQYIVDHTSYKPAKMTAMDFIYAHPLWSIALVAMFLLMCFSYYLRRRQTRIAQLIQEKNNQLEESHDTIISLQKALGSGMWHAVYDEEGKLTELTFSKEFREIFFLEDQEQFPDSKRAWLERLHPEDREAAHIELQQYFHNEVNQEDYSMPYRFLNGKNEYRWVKVKGKTQFWENGRIHRFTGFAVDVTEDYNNDFLTGSLTRDGFNVLVERFLTDKDRSGFAVVYFNIRSFKAINELWDFETGDALLKQFCQRLKNSHLQPYYIGRKGDHFVILTSQLDQLTGYVRELCDFSYHNDQQTFEVHARSGIYYLDNSPLSIATVVDRARMTENSITNEYTYPYAIYDDKMKDKYVSEAFAAAELERAITNKEFKVYYQPIVDCSTGQIASAEALVRWEHPRRGLLTPVAFIPALEKNGYISQIDHYVMDWVWDFYDKRLQSGKALVPVSVNLSWMDFADKELLKWAIECLKEYEFEKHLVRLEITESSYSAIQTDIKDLLELMKAHNATIILDDFGAGVSSMEILQRYDFKVLKLDMSMTRKIGDNIRTANLLKAIIDAAHQYGIKVIAEGVETETQVDFFRENNCDYIQGYYFYKPMPEEQFVQLLEEQQHKGILIDYTQEEELISSSYYKGYIYYPNEEMQQRANMAMNSVLRLIGENSGVGAVSGCYDDMLSICYFSNLTAELLGYNREEFLEASQGSYLRLIVPEDQDIYLKSEDMVRYYRLIDKKGRPVQIKEIRTNVQSKSGEIQWLASIRKMDNISEGELNMFLDVRKAMEKDSFTGVLTKTAFFNKISRICNADKTAPRTLIIIDIDRMKDINDVCGHLRGDEVILTVTKVLKNYFSSDFIGRFGGDEFMIFLRDDNDAGAIKRTLEHIQREVAEKLYMVKLNKNVTLSIGVCCSNAEEMSFSDFFDRADHALYEAKEAGRNTLRISK